MNGNYESIIKALGPVELTQQEQKCLEWLAGWEKETVDSIISIFGKVKQKAGQ